MLESRNEFMQGLDNFFSASVEYDASGNIICTAKDLNIVQPSGRKGVEYPWLAHYGFIRALCDEQGNILAYIRTSRVHPDPFSSLFHQGTWYAFDEYHSELIGNFQLKTPGFVLDDRHAQWSYDAATRTYTLTIPAPLGVIEHWFVVSDDYITTDYGSYHRHYLYDVRNDKPNPEITESIRSELIRNGAIPKPTPEQAPTAWQKLKNQFHGMFTRMAKKHQH